MAIRVKHFVLTYTGDRGIYILEEDLVVIRENKVKTVRVHTGRDGVMHGRILFDGKMISSDEIITRAYRIFSSVAESKEVFDDRGEFEAAVYAAEQSVVAEYAGNFNGKFFADINYPGVCYAVPEKLVKEFTEHMRGEGAALIAVSSPCDGEIVEKVIAVHETSERWGIETETEGVST